MLQYFSCIEGCSLHNVRVRLRILGAYAVEQFEAFSVDGCPCLVGRKSFVERHFLAACNPSCPFFIINVKPYSKAGQPQSIRPPTSKAGFDDVSRIGALHAVHQEFIERTVNIEFFFAQFAKISEAHVAIFGLLTKDVTAVEACPTEPANQPLDEGACAAAGVARYGDLDHAHTTHSWKQTLQRLSRGPSLVMMSLSHSGHMRVMLEATCCPPEAAFVP